MTNSPSVFLAYAHEGVEHATWVTSLAANLISNGIDVTADFYDLRGGFSLPKFMEQIGRKDKVVMICTPTYKTKADSEEGGTGFEFRIIKAELASKGEDGRFIPVLRKGSREEAIPEAVKHLVYIDLRDEVYTIEAFDDLQNAIRDEPRVRRPPLGPPPDFGNSP